MRVSPQEQEQRLGYLCAPRLSAHFSQKGIKSDYLIMEKMIDGTSGSPAG